MVSSRALCACLVAVLGCGGRYPSTTDGAKKPAAGRGGIEAAALPYQILDARSGHQIEEAAFWPRLGRARAVCIGEEHPNPHHHWVQLHVVRELAKALPRTDKLALGLEMIQRPFQGVVDDYVAHRIDGEALRSRTGWEERWGYDWSLYGPTIDATISAGGHVLALNAPKELTKKVSRQGLESLTPEEKKQVPELKLDDVNHRAWFDALMSDMGGHAAHGQKSDDNEGNDSKDSKDTKDGKDPRHARDAKDGDKADKPNPHTGAGMPEMPSADRIYTVQVMWDETMADGGAKWLAANPSGHLVILAGNGHCHDSAIVGRLKRRGVTDVVSLRPVIDAEGGVAEVLAKPMNDYVVVLRLPPGEKPAE